MKDQNDEDQSAPVAATPKQAEDAQAAWSWVEGSVWTERRLTRLASREPANRVWFSLLDKT